MYIHEDEIKVAFEMLDEISEITKRLHDDPASVSMSDIDILEYDLSVLSEFHKNIKDQL